MEVLFDPPKSKMNRAKHGISLKRAEDFDFSSAFYDVDDSQDYGEVRYNAIGWLNVSLHTLTFPHRGDKIRAISLRKATNQSKRPMTSNRSRQPAPDPENPEWTPAKFARSKRLNALPEGLQQALSAGKRGPQKSPTKTLISLRLSPDVLAALRATGKGWQTSVDEVLRRQFVK